MKHKSGLADSPFFSPSSPHAPSITTPVFPETPTGKDEEHQQERLTPRYRDTVTSRYHDTAIEQIRKAVKEFGKEAATHRFTLAEKRAIANIVHTLNMQGLRTTENEIARIAINFLIDDFNLKGKDSLLGLVLTALKK